MVKRCFVTHIIHYKLKEIRCLGSMFSGFYTTVQEKLDETVATSNDLIHRSAVFH